MRLDAKRNEDRGDANYSYACGGSTEMANTQTVLELLSGFPKRIELGSTKTVEENGRWMVARNFQLSSGVG
jgi:hypothetical protein